MVFSHTCEGNATAMSRLKPVVLLLTLGVISVLAVLAQDSPTPTITPPHYGAEVTLPPEPPTLEVTLTPSLTPTDPP